MTGLTRWDAVLFDLDGVLFDFRQAEETALAATFAHFHLPYDPDRHLALYRSVNHRYWSDFEAGRCTAADIQTRRFPDFLSRAGLTAVDPAAFNRAYLDELGRCRFLLGDPVPVLARLRGRVRMGILTNGLASVQRARLAVSPVTPFMDAVVISEEVGVAKPDSAIFCEALDRLGMRNPAAVLMVGDSLSSDIGGGFAAGLATCWFNPDRRPLPAGAPEPTCCIRRLDELPALLFSHTG